METSKNVTLTRAVIANAVSAGVEGRACRIEQEAREREENYRRMMDAAPQRATDILNGIPAAIAAAVTAANETPTSFVVMMVEPHEYGRETYQNVGIGFHGPHTGEPERLQHAAWRVFNELCHTGMKPELRFVRTTGQDEPATNLAIIIPLE